jgi:plastocyanin
MESSQEVTQKPVSSRKRGMWIAIAAALVVSGVTGFVLWNMGNDSVNTRLDAEISIGQDGMNPATVKMEQGQSITITNRDIKSHNLAADTDQLAGFENDEPLNQGDTYTYTFENKGTFHYYDPSDPSKYTGTVIVE